MNLTVEEKSGLDDIYVNIACSQIDERVNDIVAKLRLYDSKFFGALDGETHLLVADDVYYIESVDKKVFLYTEDKVFDSSMRLYEFEDVLSQAEFIRISKQMIVNFDKVSAIKPDINARLQLILGNGERVIVTRQYAPVVRKKNRYIRLHRKRTNHENDNKKDCNRLLRWLYSCDGVLPGGMVCICRIG